MKIQDENFIKEFVSLNHSEIQEKCKNLEFHVEFLEYGQISIALIMTQATVAVLVSPNEATKKYIPLIKTIE